MAVDVEGVVFTLFLKEVEEDSIASSRKLDPRFENEAVEPTGSDAGNCVPSCMPQKACVPLVVVCIRLCMTVKCGHPSLAN